MTQVDYLSIAYYAAVSNAGLDSIITLLGLGIATLSIAGLPAYLLEDVLGIKPGLAWGFGGIVWAIIVMGSPRLDFMAMIVLHRLTGLTIRSPLTLAGGILTILYFLTALAEMTDENDENQQHQV